MTSIIDSVKRLERSGSEHSKATEKLFQSCEEVANFLIDNVPQGVPFGRVEEFIADDADVYDEESAARAPRVKRHKYYVTYHHPENSNLYDGAALNMGYHTHLSGHRWSRGRALDFAKDVANGLLDSAVAAIEAETARISEAAAQIEEKNATLNA